MVISDLCSLLEAADQVSRKWLMSKHSKNSRIEFDLGRYISHSRVGYSVQVLLVDKLKMGWVFDCSCSSRQMMYLRYYTALVFQMRAAVFHGLPTSEMTEPRPIMTYGPSVLPLIMGLTCLVEFVYVSETILFCDHVKDATPSQPSAHMHVWGGVGFLGFV